MENRLTRNACKVDNLLSEQARFPWIDFCRGIAIILMVAGYTGTLGLINKIIYAFHMPLFVMISGFLYKVEYDELSIKNILRCCKINSFAL